MMEWDQGVESLMLNSPRQIAADPTSLHAPCIYFNGTIWVKPGTVMDYFETSSQTMSIIFHEGLSLRLNDFLWISATVGSLTMPSFRHLLSTYFTYRSIAISLSSGSATGTYSLFDSLSITTRSGNIDIDIDLHEASHSKLEPVDLKLESTSGDINVRTPILRTSLFKLPFTIIPYRVYRSTISTGSSNIRVELVHGNNTSLRSSSGSISARLVPYDTLSQASEITSTNAAGDTDIIITPSLLHPESPIKKLYGSFSSLTGSLCVTFPKTWEGTLVGQTLSSTLFIDWSFMVIISDSRQGSYWRQTRAIKGNGEGEVSFQQTSGSVTLRDGSTL